MYSEECVWMQVFVNELEEGHWCDVCFCVSFRLPEPRADPVDPRDFEDNDSGPSMDHAPWCKHTQVLLHPPVIHCLLQPAASTAEVSVESSYTPHPSFSFLVPAGSELTLKKPAVTNMDSHVFSTLKLF